METQEEFCVPLPSIIAWPLKKPSDSNIHIDYLIRSLPTEVST